MIRDPAMLVTCWPQPESEILQPETPAAGESEQPPPPTECIGTGEAQELQLETSGNAPQQTVDISLATTNVADDVGPSRYHRINQVGPYHK
mmetsp:Transcript_11891/g.17475  ORF Transcript_11891/g.17475 Transcript_11891/m.17475 type:complete len:91 (-) Transcript_11891:1720-1992(-)